MKKVIKKITILLIVSLTFLINISFVNAETLYRVVSGSFTNVLNANKQLSLVKSKGYTDAYINNENGLYSVNIGTFKDKTNASNFVNSAKKIGVDAFIRIVNTGTTTSSNQNSSQSQTTSNTSSNQSTSYTDFVNIKSLDSSIIVELIYNTANNFTGKRIYDFNQAILRTSTAKKLVYANSILKSQGYVIKIWDAYRPLSAQEVLWNAYPDPNFVAKADPNNIRGHQLGATVDITICTLDGKEVNMQSGYDDFTSKAYRNYMRTQEQEKNYNIMNNAMLKAGFTGYVNEWWEYRDTNQNFVPLQVNPKNY